MHRKKHFEIVLEFKSDKAVLTFSFHFVPFPRLSLFLPFFSLARHLEGFTVAGKVCGKAFTIILGLDERKGRTG